MKKKHFFPFVVAMLFLVLNAPTRAQSLSPTVVTIKQTANAVPPESFCAATMDRFKSIAVYPDATLTYFEGIYTTSSGNILENYFVLNQGTAPITMFSVPGGLHVVDFEHLPYTDIIAFCGYIDDPSMPYNSVGMLGWFDFSTVPTSAPSFYYLRTDDFVHVQKIVPYKDGSDAHVAAIGEKRVSTGWGYSLIHSRITLTPSPTNVDFFSYDVRQSEAPDDIIKTENYLVFIGTDCTQSSNTMFIRKEKYLNFSNQSFSELYDVYCFTEPDGEYPMSWYGTYLGNEIQPGGDMIAVGGPLNLYNNQIVSRYRTYDVVSMTNTDAQQIVLSGKVATADMAYTHSPGLLAVLLGADPLTGSSPSVAIMLNPYAIANYSADGIFDSDGTAYASIDNLNCSNSDCEHFVMGGFSPLGVKWLLKSSTNLTSANNCNGVKQYNVEIVQPIDPQYSTDILGNMSTNHSLVQGTSQTKVLLNSISTCMDP